jgi:hypothetical protein
MSPVSRRNLSLFGGAAVLVLLALLFPPLRAFAELASRELRYLWWLVLIAALGIWLAFFLRHNRD